MPTIIVTTNIIKPKDKSFFAESSAENLALVRSIQAWNANQSGFISQAFEDPTPDHRVVTITWDSMENYNAWNSAFQVHPAVITRKEYNDANGIVSTLSETIR